MFDLPEVVLVRLIVVAALGSNFVLSQSVLFCSIYVCMFVYKTYSCGQVAGRSRLKIAYRS